MFEIIFLFCYMEMASSKTDPMSDKGVMKLTSAAHKNWWVVGSDGWCVVVGVWWRLCGGWCVVVRGGWRVAGSDHLGGADGRLALAELYYWHWRAMVRA